MKSLDTEMKGSMVRKRETEKRLKYKNIIQSLMRKLTAKVARKKENWQTETQY